MDRPSAQSRTWTDAQLTDAVRTASSWRGVMRELGLNATSAGAIRIVRRHTIRLGLDTSHFRGKRRWSDAQLALKPDLKHLRRQAHPSLQPARRHFMIAKTLCTYTMRNFRDHELDATRASANGAVRRILLLSENAGVPTRV